MPPVIQVENLSKLYRLGEVSTGTISHDLNRWWHKVRGKEDPYLKIGQVNDRTKTRKKAENGKAAGANAENGNAETLKSDSLSAFQNLSVSAFESDYVYALKDINFSVNQGEVLGIIGRNGAGKSTLLKILSRVTAPSSGRIKVKGRIASLLEVGTGFHPELTGRENIYLNGAILGMRRHEITRKLDEIVDFSGCAAYLDTPVKRYSSGMYVRLAFAVAANLEPEILVVDEVLAVGDAEFQKKCIGKMKAVAGEGRTVLFVSHNMAAVSNLCSTGIIMKRGLIQLVGSMDDCISNYFLNTENRKLIDLGDCRIGHYRQISRIVEFLDVQMAGGNSRVRYGTTPEVVLTLLASETLNGLSIGGSIFDASSVCVGTFFSAPSLQLTANVSTKVTVELELPELVPGHYTFGFSVGIGSEASKRNDFDVVIGIPEFEVTSVGVENNIATWSRNWGNLCLNKRVTIKDLSIANSIL